MADAKGYMKDLSKRMKIWRRFADVAVSLACLTSLATTVTFALFPDAAFSESGEQIKPGDGARAMAWIMLIVTVVLIVVILRQRLKSTRESLQSEQKVELWGGAAGLFILFTMGNHVTDDARNGLMGAMGLVLFLGAAVLLEPLAVELKERAESEKDDREEAKHREMLTALSAVKGSPAPAPAPSAARRGRRLFGLRLFRRS